MSMAQPTPDPRLELSTQPLPDDLRHGLFAPAIFGALSCIATFGLIIFLVCRFIRSRKERNSAGGFVGSFTFK